MCVCAVQALQAEEWLEMSMSDISNVMPSHIRALLTNWESKPIHVHVEAVSIDWIIRDISALCTCASLCHITCILKN